MPSFSSVDWTEDGVGNNVIKMHANRELITDVLKRSMRFHGLVISDWEGIHQIPGDWPTQVRTGVNAGIDMMMEPNAYQSFITTLIDEVNAGNVPMSRINDAVRRILAKKFELGLFEKPFTDRRNQDKIGSRAHHKVAREAAAKSSVLLKNEDDTLPLGSRGDVYVAGSNANKIGNQAGGWTITWQGNSNHVIPGTTILDGIRELSRGHVTYSKDASAPIPPSDAGIVVVGETPYSEGFGDVGGPRWGFDPGENGVLRPVKDMQLSAGGQGRCGQGVRGGPELHRGGCLRPSTHHRPTAAGLDRRAGGCLAPGERGRGRGRHAVRATRIHRQAADDVAANARPGADQRWRRQL